MIKDAIMKLSQKQDLTYAEAEAVMNEIMSGETTPEMLAGSKIKPDLVFGDLGQLAACLGPETER